MKQYSYLVINFSCILVPLICSFYKKHSFFKEWKYFFPANSIISIIFIIWDVLFTENGIWGFNEDYLIGINIINLPLEEVLFFICIPYACVFTFFAIKQLIPFSVKIKSQKVINVLIAIILIVLGFIYFEKAYTASSFLLAAFILLSFSYLKLSISYIYLTYLITVPFFLLSNGALTGMFSENPIVWYDGINNTEIRVITIPIEDFVYGFSLISMNIFLYELIKHKSFTLLFK